MNKQAVPCRGAVCLSRIVVDVLTKQPCQQTTAGETSTQALNSVASGICGTNLMSMIFKHIMQIIRLTIRRYIVPRWSSAYLTNNKKTGSGSHHLSHCWPMLAKVHCHMVSLDHNSNSHKPKEIYFPCQKWNAYFRSRCQIYWILFGTKTLENNEATVHEDHISYHADSYKVMK